MLNGASRLVLLSLLCAVVSYGQGDTASNLRKAKIAANEATAIGALRVLVLACVTYKDKYGVFPASLAELGPGLKTSASHANLVSR